MSLIRLPLLLLGAYGLIALAEGAHVALGSGVGTELSRGVLTVAGVLWLLHGLRRGQAWAWWLATGGAVVFLISVATALLVAALDGRPAGLPPTLLAKTLLLAAAAVLLLRPTSRRYYLGRQPVA
ncbi:hypothetical protein [Immundisolibacter sp.]|uniref:hypothetical protein n=1 Tax=Immundisolibacter sp. TaxID=1934948 RepID=UPI0026233257|nr:hypothetical protein [Immundisolibacter sp.]MDD3651327.1 hypothetical protein [Immundisolibacter sp.]